MRFGRLSFEPARERERERKVQHMHQKKAVLSRTESICYEGKNREEDIVICYALLSCRERQKRDGHVCVLIEVLNPTSASVLEILTFEPERGRNATHKRRTMWF
jgi:hypothetical protein